VTTVAYVFKVTLNEFAAQKPILRKKNNKYENCTPFRNNKYENFTPFNEGDLNESYISYNYSFYIAKL
jgi:hypothetical protein